MLLPHTQDHPSRTRSPQPLTSCTTPSRRDVLLPRKCSIAPPSLGRFLSCSSAAGTRPQCPAPPGSPPHRRSCLGLAIPTVSEERTGHEHILGDSLKALEAFFCRVASGQDSNYMGQNKTNDQIVRKKKKKPYSVVSRTHPKSPLLLYRSCTINPLESKQDTPIIELHYMAKVKEFYRYSNSKSADFE